MRRIILVVLAASALGSVAWAQATDGSPPCPGPGACGGLGRGRGGGPGARGYDPATVTTVSGTVDAVESGPGGRRGVHVHLKTADGVLEVHLGPAAWLEQQKLTLQKGDAIEVTGSKRQTSRGSFLVAKWVRSGDTQVTLRDANGVPAWAGSRRP